MATLLEPAFVRELEAMRRRLVVRVPSGGAGEHLSRRRGGSAEFLEHRPYTPGDDLRRIDWLAYARSGEPVVKQFRAEEDLVLRLLIDTSASLHGSKLATAVRIAAALGYIALASSERVQTIPCRDGTARPSRPVRGRRGLPGFLHGLSNLDAAGQTDLAAGMDAALTRGRPGMLAVISDFLDPGTVQGALTRARAAGHDVVLVQVLARDEVVPALMGDVLLEDAETSDAITLSADADVVDAYLARLAGLIETLRRWSRTHGATYVRVLSDESVEDAIRRILDRRIDA